VVSFGSGGEILLLFVCYDCLEWVSVTTLSRLSCKGAFRAERCNYTLSKENNRSEPSHKEKKFTNTHSPPTNVVAHSNSQISLPHSMEPMRNRLPSQPCSKSLCSSQAAAPNKQEAQSVPEHP